MSCYWNTIRVCQDCMLHHANGECGDCHSDEGHDCEPWATWENGGQFIIFSGIRAEDHDESCDGRDGYCDCEEDTHSTSQCEGCGSYLHGERHAFTVFHK